MFDPTRTIQLVKGALLEPEATWHSYLPEAGDWKKTAVLLTGPLIVAAALTAYVLGLLFSGLSFFGMRPTLATTVINIVTGAIAIGIVAFILSTLAKTFGGKANFALGLAGATLAFVPGYVGQALSGLPLIGWLLGLGLLIYGLVLLWRIIPLYLEVPDEKRAPHYALSLISSAVVMFVLSTVIGGSMMGPGMRPGMGGGIGGPRAGSPATESGPFAGIARQGELIAMAEEDRYDPPSNGEVTEAQIRAFIDLMQRTRNAVAERAARMQEIAERAENDEEVSISDFSAMMSGMSQVVGLNTLEIEMVKSAGGNWAEHQWVKQTLRTAWLQKDLNDTIAYNYALYQEYEDELAEFIVQ